VAPGCARRAELGPGIKPSEFTDVPEDHGTPDIYRCSEHPAAPGATGSFPAIRPTAKIPIHYFTRIFETSTVGSGNFMSSPFKVSTRIWDTARLRDHFRSAGITYQGAQGVLQRVSASS
jgi:hypothetical protein